MICLIRYDTVPIHLNYKPRYVYLYLKPVITVSNDRYHMNDYLNKNHEEKCIKCNCNSR